MESFLFEIDISNESHTLLFTIEKKIHLIRIVRCIFEQFSIEKFDYSPSIEYLDSIDLISKKEKFFDEYVELLRDSLLSKKKKTFQYFKNGRYYSRITISPWDTSQSYEKKIQIIENSS